MRKQQPVTTKGKIQNQKQYQNALMSLADTMEDPEFSLYSDDTEEAHTVKAVTGRMPTYQDNW
jgi:hypothetical protein